MARLIVVMSEDRPSAPRNIQADTVSSSAILLAWERPQYNSDKVIAYSVHYMKAEGESLCFILGTRELLIPKVQTFLGCSNCLFQNSITLRRKTIVATR